MHLQGGDLVLVCRVCGELENKDRSWLCSYGYRRLNRRKGILSRSHTVRLDMFGTEAENCGVSFSEKGSSLFVHSSDEMSTTVSSVSFPAILSGVT